MNTPTTTDLRSDVALLTRFSELSAGIEAKTPQVETFLNLVFQQAIKARSEIEKLTVNQETKP